MLIIFSPGLSYSLPTSQNLPDGSGTISKSDSKRVSIRATDSSDDIANNLFSSLQDNDFATVEKYFDHLLETKEKNKYGTHLSWDVYKALVSEHEEYEAGVFDKWCSASSHYSAFVARGNYHIRRAWEARGSGYSNMVSDEEFKVFRQRLSKAINDFETAYAMNSAEPNIAANMLIVIKGLGLDDSVREIWYELGIAADPSFYWIYLQKLSDLLPKWGGSWEEAFGFAIALYENPPENSLADSLILTLIDEAISKTYSPDLQLLLGGIELSFDDISAFLEQLEKEYAWKPTESIFITLKIETVRGLIWLYAKQDDKAEQSIRKIIAVSPENARAWYMLGVLYYGHLKKFEEGIEYLTRAIALDDKDGRYFMSRGDAYFINGRFEESIVDFTKSISLKYRDVEIYRILAAAYRQMGMMQSAIDTYTEGLNYHNDFWLVSARADTYAKKGDLEQAIKDYEFLVKAKPSNKSYQSSLERLHYERIMLEGLTRKPDKDVNWYMLGNMHWQEKNEFDKAVVYLSNAIALDDTNGLYYFERGFVYSILEKYEYAISDLKKGVELGEKTVEVYMTIARAYLALGKSNEAIESFSEGLLYFDVPEIRHHRAMAYEESGELTSALRDYKKLVQQQPENEGYMEEVERLKNQISSTQ